MTRTSFKLPAMLGAILAITLSASACLAVPTSMPSIELTGKWGFLPGLPENDKDDMTADPAKFTGWQDVNVPGNWPVGNLPFAWQVKRFDVPAGVKGLDCEAVLRARPLERDGLAERQETRRLPRRLRPVPPGGDRRD